jgi:7-cyano-7-deazaguanine synthase
MKAMVVLSGGLDSTTLLHKLLDDGHDCRAISFDYGQKHSKELDYAVYWTTLLGIKHEFVNLSGVFTGSALTNDKQMPLEDYSIESMKATVVPNRNMVMLSIAISKAIQHGCDAIAYGAHAGDRDVYPDCRHEFVDAMRQAAMLCDWNQIKLLAPLIDMNKREIVALARKLKIDIKRTWSCYEGAAEPCGQCGSCRALREAMSA